ncbi:hypothetical protein ARMGADRAFT_1031900 [Armillaria gallica]|uniref:Uncharacterized protein n=1 Tax=Armillaria gallica TaxID=47427 RepID=A0A2H3DUU0_ARMGA|nr:hypothetical protein ARMGADRAFT_1031900 [Armillaria gallica]
MTDKTTLTKRVIQELTYQIESKEQLPTKWTCTIRQAYLYRNLAMHTAIVPVALEHRQSHNIKVTDFDTNRWVHDICANIYKLASGHDTIHLDGDETHEVFFCPLQEVGDRVEYENWNNPNITCLGEIGMTWYSNVLVLKTVNGEVVDMTKEEAPKVRASLKKFTDEYIRQWKEDKLLTLSGADYNLVKEDKLNYFVEL